jgi:hypothetical protein
MMMGAAESIKNPDASTLNFVEVALNQPICEDEMEPW